MGTESGQEFKRGFKWRGGGFHFPTREISRVFREVTVNSSHCFHYPRITAATLPKLWKIAFSTKHTFVLGILDQVARVHNFTNGWVNIPLSVIASFTCFIVYIFPIHLFIFHIKMDISRLFISIDNSCSA